MKTTAIFVWGLALAVTGNLTYSAIRHNMPILNTTAITLLTLYAAKAGAENLVAIVRRAKTGATR